MSRFTHRTNLPLLTTAVLLLVATGMFHAPLLEWRRTTSDGIETAPNAPPTVLFTTVVLGGFRGVIADGLWLRASYLQDEGRYLELVQLVDWITKLEPHNTDVWAFHAWNLAYNVSVMMPVAEDRWRWIEESIRLLRDKGVLYNPTDPRIYHELGWIFQHKLGGDSDRLHAYYKRELADSVARWFGPTGRADYDALAKDAARCEQIKRVLGLDIERMRIIDAVYGPLDWRVPQSHAIYWAYRGREVAGSEGGLDCSRMIYQSMAELFLWGKMKWTPAGELIMELDKRLLRGVFRAFEDALARYDEPSLDNAYANFLAGATRVLFEQGDQRRARRCFDRLHERYPSAATFEGFRTFIAAGAES